jgi:VWFA-related protein
MQMRVVLDSVLVSVLCCAARGQTPAPEVTTHDAPAVFRIGTNLVLVPVVVRDPQGRAVGNLTQEDFQLFDKGKPQTILKFSLEKPGSGSTPAIVATSTNESGVEQPALAPVRPPAVVPERFVAFIFDDEHLLPGDFLNVRAAANRNLTETMKDAGARVAIYTTSGHQSLDFTDDLDRARDTLNRIIPQRNGLAKDERCPDISYYWADLIVTKGDTQAFEAAITETCVCLNLDPTVAANREIAKPLARSAAIADLDLGRRESLLGLSVIDDVVRRISAAPGSRRIVLVSPGFYLDQDLRGKQMSIFDRAIRSNVTINSLDGRGLYAVVPGGSVANQSDHADQATYIFAARLQSESVMLETNVMAELADATGGKFFHNDNGLVEGFAQLAAQPEYLYILGFAPQNLKMDGSRHILKVSLKNGKGFDLQARRDYYAPDHKADAAEQATEDIRSAVFSRDEMQEIPVDVSLQFFKSSDVSARLTVVTKLDLKTLHFRKDEDRNDETLTLVSSVFDRNGNFVNGTQRVIDMRLKDQTLETLLSQGITVKTTHDLTPGSYLVRLVVRDSEGQAMAARNGSVEIP